MFRSEASCLFQLICIVCSYFCAVTPLSQDSESVRCSQKQLTLPHSEYSFTQNEVRLVLVGRTGSGISSSGNSILRQHFFFSDISGSSVTNGCRFGTTERKGQLVKVIDTPGFFGNRLEEEEIKREILNCFKMSLPGPNAILYVLRIGRFTNEEIKGIQRFLEIFGGNPLQYTILLFTGEDDLRWNKSSKEEFIGNAPVYLKKLVQKCDNRYIFLNNRLSYSGDSDNQLNELFSTVNNLLKKNIKRPYYENQILEQVKEVPFLVEDYKNDIRNPDSNVKVVEFSNILNFCKPMFFHLLATIGFGHRLARWRVEQKVDDTLSKVIDELKEDNTFPCKIS